MSALTSTNGAITITKICGADERISVTIRDGNSKRVALIPIERFGHVLMGLAEEPCVVKTSVGKFHGTGKAMDSIESEERRL